jgi:glutamate-1-semialdehyde 2,1-aminomutase
MSAHLAPSRARRKRAPSIERSLALWKEAQTLIPGGSQLLSRRPQLFAFGVSPIFAEKAKGAYFWDVDGNRYLDMTMSVGAVLLGYCDPDVDRAFDRQRRKSTIFSLIPPVEIEAARLLTQVIPCAEMVRFGKSGGEANAVAVRIARAYTGKGKVAFCGYHGWHDWYISANLGDSRSLESYLMPGVNAHGVPAELRGTVIPFEYNNIDSLRHVLEANRNEVACVIMEASRTFLPSDGFLQNVRELTQQHGVLLIFDEVVTGFRLALGGAQEHYGVRPDLATFGKTIANGYPLTAIAGRRDVMDASKDLFISSTFWDDAATLAAGVATVAKMRELDVAGRIAVQGRRYMQEWEALAARHGINARLIGSPASPVISFGDPGPVTPRQQLTLYIQEMARRNVFCGGGFNLALAHQDKEIETVLAAADDSLGVLRKALDDGDVGKYLAAEEQRPLFQSRMV